MKKFIITEEEKNRIKGLYEQSLTPITSHNWLDPLGVIPMAKKIMVGSSTSEQKIKQFCDLCKKSKSQITLRSNKFADTIRDAVSGLGTNEDAIYKTFNSLSSFDEFCSLVLSYRKSYNTELYNDLYSDIDSESEWVLIFRPIRDLLLKSKNQPVSQSIKTLPSQATSGKVRPTTTIKK
jgi:hypothetical protein